MLAERHPKAAFEWRVTRFSHANLYTLIGWSNVKEYVDLPPEYTCYTGPKFWADGERSITLDNDQISTLPRRRTLDRGTVLEETEYKTIKKYLRKASCRLQSINLVLQTSSECFTMVV